ncbi:MAG TPA: DUF5666 domain-containing protein [Gammaproteobacteria bacterium]|nr:DUF5666 domain-containing protein [Gammaproteobacteria bacterium]
MKARTFSVVTLATLVLALSGCGGGGSQTAGIEGSGVNGSGTKAPAITSSGAVTALGSIFVNGIEYDVSKAVITLNGAPATETDLEVGSVVIVEGDVDATGTKGTARRVTAGIALAGPIERVDTAADTLTVLGQTVELDPTVIIEKRIDGLPLGGLTAGDDVEITGFADSTGAWTALRIAPRRSTTPLQVTGRAANVDSTNRRFSVAGQVIDYASATFVGGTAQALDGAPVRVTANGRDANGVLLAREVVFRDLRLPGSVGDLAAVQGWVTRFASDSDFDVDGHPVVTTAATVVAGQEATLAKVRLDSFVSVRGTLIQGGVVQATEVRTNTLISLGSVVWSIDDQWVRGDLTDFYSYQCHIEADTVFTVDGLRATRENIVAGDVATIYEHHPNDGTPSRCQIVAVEHAIRGPLESKPTDSASMIVMGQRVWLDTSRSTNGFFPAVQGFDTLDTLNVGDIVEVGGHLTAAGDIVGKSLHAAGTSSGYRVIGFVHALDGALKRFKLGGLTVDYAGAAVAGFPGGSPAEGQRVLVTSEFAPNVGVLRATAIRYDANVPHGATSNVLKLNGLVTRYASPDDFDVDGRSTIPLRGPPFEEPASTWARRCDMSKVHPDMRFERLVTVGNDVGRPPIYFRPICLPGTQIDERAAIGSTDFYPWAAIMVTGPVESIDLATRSVRVAGVGLMLHPGSLLARFEAPPATSTANVTSAPVSLEDLVVGERVSARVDGLPKATGIRPVATLWLGSAVPMPEEQVRLEADLESATEPELVRSSGLRVRVPDTAVFEGEGCYSTFTYDATEFWNKVVPSISRVVLSGSMIGGEFAPARVSFFDPTDGTTCSY